MIDEEKKINRQFTRTLIFTIAYVLVMVGAFYLVSLFINSGSLRYALYLLLFFSMYWPLSIFRRRMSEITILSYLIKISKNQAKPLDIKHCKNLEEYGRYLRSKDFLRYSVDDKHELYYRLYKDTVKKMFRRNMLDVVVIVHNSNDPFYIEAVEREITEIQDEQIKLKNKIFHMFVTQIKPIEELDDKTREEIKEIVFIRTRHTVISTINIGLHYPSNKAVLLYSDTYSPSLYYNHHVELIKSII